MTNPSDSKPIGTKYEPPRAVRLGDAAAGTGKRFGTCAVGSDPGTPGHCKPGLSASTDCVYGFGVGP